MGSLLSAPLIARWPLLQTVEDVASRLARLSANHLKDFAAKREAYGSNVSASCGHPDADVKTGVFL